MSKDITSKVYLSVLKLHLFNLISPAPDIFGQLPDQVLL